MSQVFEVFGYPIDDTTEEAKQNRLAASCPFMARACDGGGNRFSSKIDLSKTPELQLLYPERADVHAGICSIQTEIGASPWVVCPRRLLVLGRDRDGDRARQKESQRFVLSLLGYPAGTRLGVWSEVKFKYQEVVGDIEKSFDYTFDYVVVPLGSASVPELAEALGIRARTLMVRLVTSGYTIAVRDGVHFVDDWPIGTPSILEIMTSSTSGGNKRTRTGIAHAFEDAMLGKSHRAPGINYRQVWARMVSQLIVKSEIALHWGGKAVWLVQDVLVDYIRESTALNISAFLSDHLSEVNMLSFSYGDAYRTPSGVIELSRPTLYAGPITPIGAPPAGPSFSDMIRAPLTPSTKMLALRLLQRKPSNEVTAP